jgi:hypothetical protein
MWVSLKRRNRGELPERFDLIRQDQTAIQDAHAETIPADNTPEPDPRTPGSTVRGPRRDERQQQ